jgi:hypothetical protein
MRLAALARDDGMLAIGLGNAAPRALDLELRDERGRSITYRIVPGYRIVQPKGPRCEPACAMARVTFRR